MDTSPPEDFIHHPVPNTGKEFLHEQDSLDEGPLSALQNVPDQFKGKGIGMNLGRQVAPPLGGVLALMAEDATELAGVPENKASVGLAQNEGIVLGGWVCRILLEKPTGHSEMEAEPSFPGKAKEHFFAVGFGPL